MAEREMICHMTLLIPMVVSLSNPPTPAEPPTAYASPTKKAIMAPAGTVPHAASTPGSSQASGAMDALAFAPEERPLPALTSSK